MKRINTKLSLFLKVAFAIYLSAIFTLYLAPTPEKYLVADMLAVLLLLPLLMICKKRISTSVIGFKPIIPLFVLISCIGLQTWIIGAGDTAGYFYILQLLYGLSPYIFFYVIFRNLAEKEAEILLMAVLVIPGLVHIGYLYLDIILKISSGDVAFMVSSKHGLLEDIKNTPRVGRRYVSMALLHLLCGGVVVAWYIKNRLVRYLALTLACVSVLSLALLDARAAYASIFIGALLLVLAVGPRETWGFIVRAQKLDYTWRFIFVGVFVTAIGLGYSSGKSRWVAMAYSVEWAVNDVFKNESPLSMRPYVDTKFWSDPIEDVSKCYLAGEFRCRADQSAYLRTAWLLEGAKSLFNYPIGIGYSDNFMSHLWSLEGIGNKYQRIDSFLIEQIVSFGWFAILIFGWFFRNIAFAIRHAVYVGKASAALLILSLLLLTCVGRMLVDVFNEGLWRYLMALMGVYYALIHRNNLQVEEN